MNYGLVLAASVAALGRVASAQEALTLEPVEVQEVVAVKDASRAQVYDAARAWFIGAFNGAKDELVQNPLAGTLIGTGSEKYAPLYADGSCSFWLRYRVILGARDGRYYYSIGGLSLELDPICQRRSFRVPMTGWLGTMAVKPSLNFALQSPRSADDDRQVQRDLQQRAATLVDTLARSLRASLARAAGGKPRGISDQANEG